MLKVGNPFPQFNDLSGALLDAGYIYAGTAGTDPEVSPIQLYWDTDLTIPATQPLRTRGGYIVNDNGAPALVFTGLSDFSMRVKDADGNLVWFLRSANESGVSYQPLDSDLTAIANTGTTSFGRSLLTAGSALAARILLGLSNYLSTTGGTMTGNILRSGGGPHLYHGNGAYTSGKVLTTSAGAADPTINAGEIWLELAP